MKVLFVCSANVDRSRTAEDHFAERYENHQFLSAGTNSRICKKRGTTELTLEMLRWAEVIYVMEKKHAHIIKKLTGAIYIPKVKILGIPDIYLYNDADLIAILQEKIVL